MTEKRWLDEEDFTPQHDEMMVDLCYNWEKIVRFACPELIKVLMEENAWNLIAEPGLGKYQKVYPDAAIGEANRSSPTYYIAIEVKPKIVSLGATLRQLRSYRMELNPRYGAVILFTNDPRYDWIFRQQGYRVIHGIPEGDE